MQQENNNPTTPRERVVIRSIYNPGIGGCMRFCMEWGYDCVAHYWPEDEFPFDTAEECLRYHNADRIEVID